MDKNKIIAIGLAIIMIGVLIPIGLSLFSDGKLENTADLDESVRFWQNIDELNVTESNPNSYILLPESGTNAHMDFDIGSQLNSTPVNINETHVIEDSTNDTNYALNVARCMSFNLTNSCYLSNISIQFYGNVVESTLWLFVTPSYHNVTSGNYAPVNGFDYTTNTNYLYSTLVRSGIIYTWLTFENYTCFLDNSNTEDNVWFLTIVDVETNAKWYADNNDGNDEGIAGIMYSNGINYLDSTIDFELILGLYEVGSVNPSYSYAINYDATEIDINFTLTDIEWIIIENVSWYCDIDYTFVSHVIINATIDFTYNDYSFYLNVSHSRLFDVALVTLNTTNLAYSEPSETMLSAELDNGYLEITFEYANNSVTTIFNLFPLFVVIAIVLVIVYEIKQKQED